MPTILRVHGSASSGWVPDEPTWLETFDIDFYDGLGRVRMTTDRWRAYRFPDFGAAMGAWKTQSLVRPLRPDGKPNRPLTAFTVEPEEL